MQDNTKMLEKYEAKAPTMIEAAKTLDITTPDGEARAESWLIEGREFCKNAEAELVEPWRQVKRDADAQMKKLTATIITPVMGVVNTLKVRLANQRTERKQIADAAAAKAQAEIDAKVERERRAALAAAEKLKTPELREQRMAEAESMVAPVIVAPVAKPTGSKLATVKTWTFEVTDASKIPAQYLVPDMVKIGGVVRVMKGDTDIPGVKVIKRESVR